jgi:MauM/NapG family ferredoxin protein
MNRAAWHAGLGRKMVQAGFLVLFLFPWLPVFLSKAGAENVPDLTSWLLPFDPLANLTKVLHGNFLWVAAGPALFILVFSWVFGRSFCGWICPLGTLLDIFRPLAFWQKRQTVRPSGRNNPVRFRLLAVVLTASILSMQFAGWLDPLVIFNRAVTAFSYDLGLLDLSNLRIFPFAISLLFLAILVLELIRPRFWCRNLCPFGALVSLPARFSRLNRRVTNTCTYCGECRTVCPMQAIGVDPHETRYTDCTFCLDCEAACPNQGIRFEFGHLAGAQWQKDAVSEKAAPKTITGDYATGKPVTVTRRQAIETMVAGGTGLAAVPLLDLARPKNGLVRPPGALPEGEFTRTCITCHECIRICPSQALRPALLEGGLTSLGTPYLAPRQAACSFLTNCSQLCAQACPVGAIRSIPVSQMKTGIAKVDHHACLAWDQGVKCLVCVEACLSDAAKAVNGRIIVDQTKCTGCGRCESGCPVAGSAIRVFPLS